jgi:hypothetical protein
LPSGTGCWRNTLPPSPSVLFGLAWLWSIPAVALRGVPRLPASMLSLPLSLPIVRFSPLPLLRGRVSSVPLTLSVSPVPFLLRLLPLVPLVPLPVPLVPVPLVPLVPVPPLAVLVLVVLLPFLLSFQTSNSFLGALPPFFCVQSHLNASVPTQKKEKKKRKKGTPRAGIPKINSGTDTGGRSPPVRPPEFLSTSIQAPTHPPFPFCPIVPIPFNPVQPF